MVIDYTELPKVRVDNIGKRLVLALGTFDILHVGHKDYLEWAKQQGDLLIVTLKSDVQVTSHKGPARPIIKEDERVVMVDAMKPVDYALIGAEGSLYEAAKQTAKELDADVIVLGPDWGNEVLARWQADFDDKKVLIAPNQSDQSTSRIISKIIANEPQ